MTPHEHRKRHRRKPPRHHQRRSHHQHHKPNRQTPLTRKQPLHQRKQHRSSDRNQRGNPHRQSQILAPLGTNKSPRCGRRQHRATQSRQNYPSQSSRHIRTPRHQNRSQHHQQRRKTQKPHWPETQTPRGHQARHHHRHPESRTQGRQLRHADLQVPRQSGNQRPGGGRIETTHRSTNRQGWQHFPLVMPDFIGQGIFHKLTESLYLSRIIKNFQELPIMSRTAEACQKRARPVGENLLCPAGTIGFTALGVNRPKHNRQNQ